MRKALFYIGLISSITLSLLSCVNDIETSDNSSKNDIQHFNYKISIEEAQSDLESLLCDIDAANSRWHNSLSHRTIKSSYPIPISSSCSRSDDTDTTHLYVFNFEGEEGYAIMSGDKRLPSLISLTDSGSLEEEEEIDDPGVALFLEGMDNMYLERKQNNNSAYEDDIIVGNDSNQSGYVVYGDWQNIVYYQYGFCPVKWSQGSPYNMYCPVMNNTSAVTGCVATAVAQLMAIYKYHQYYNDYLFSWDDMTNSKYGYLCTNKGQSDIARLMQQLGLKENLDISYGTNSSGAKSENIIRTLKSFGYSQPGTITDYKTSEVIEDLKMGYGVLICGYSSKTVTRFLGIKVKTKYSGGASMACSWSA